ncbi:hypothetical protein EJ06DRAFT_482993 [Trichodelitschia bisporula]|uniref:Rhodopsin domain-containing protein n=1 Tax=Trichodelitschia bisporula TaxID=703511 RepID=A0A6G1HMI1_9PEZI|nr:hypothetical protein EJ06DRAFT_482993 [Trichodelitschia bisporula]
MSSTDDRMPSRAHAQAVVAIVFLALAWPFVLLRVWVRKYMMKSFGWDDWLMVVSTFVIANIAIFLVTTMFLKLSLGFFFLRIAVVRWQRWFIYGIMALSTVVHVCNTFVVLFQCKNPKDTLLKTLLHQCLPRDVILGFAYEQVAVATFCDFALAILPVSILWNTKMNSRTKFSIGCLLMLGTIASICSAIRIRYIVGLVAIDGFLYHAANAAIWSTAEMGIGIISGSLATLRPLFRKLAYTTRSLVVPLPYKSLSKGTGTQSSRGQDPKAVEVKHIGVLSSVANIEPDPEQGDVELLSVGQLRDGQEDRRDDTYSLNDDRSFRNSPTTEQAQSTRETV